MEHEMRYIHYRFPIDAVKGLTVDGPLWFCPCGNWAHRNRDTTEEQAERAFARHTRLVLTELV